MRRNLKTALHKLGAAFAALAVAVSLAPATALATPTSATDVADSTVTITDLLEGDTVSVYLIADADIDAANNLTYTMASNLPADYDTIAELDAIASDGTSFTQGSAMQNAAAAIAKSLSDANTAAVVTGVAGGLTTFSTLGVEIVDLVRDRARARLALLLAAHVVLGLACATIGYRLGTIV